MRRANCFILQVVQRNFLQSRPSYNYKLTLLPIYSFHVQAQLSQHQLLLRSLTLLAFQRNITSLNMSIVVYRGLHSRLESQMEYRALKLKLSSPKLYFSQSLEMALQSCVIVPSHGESKKLDGPSSNEVCQNTTSHIQYEKAIGSYMHPSAKHSSWLSEKSLSLCTENLGSETGSEFIENSIFSAPACSFIEIKKSVKKVQQPIRNREVSKPKKQFPPPLTTLNGLHSLHVRPHREDGRLILKATRSDPTVGSCFQVDRSNGRLRLSLADPCNYSKTKQTTQDDDDK